MCEKVHISFWKHLGYSLHGSFYLFCDCTEEDIIYAVYCSHDDCVEEERHHADIQVTEDGSWVMCCIKMELELHKSNTHVLLQFFAAKILVRQWVYFSSWWYCY